MIVTIKPHAEMRMKDRGVAETQVREVLRNPKAVISVRYGRFAAYGEIEDRRLLVIYEKKERGVEVVTALWVDERRLRRLGFAGV